MSDEIHDLELKKEQLIHRYSDLQYRLIKESVLSENEIKALRRQLKHVTQDILLIDSEIYDLTPKDPE